MKTLYVSDLDGTLLNMNSALSAFTLDTVNSLVAQGVNFTYATARSLSSSLMVTVGLDKKIPVIVHNGACIQDAVSGKTIYSVCFSESEKQLLRSIFEPLAVCPIFYALLDGDEQVAYKNQYINDGIRFYLKRGEGKLHFRAVEDDSDLFSGDGFHCNCIGDEAMIRRIYEAVLETGRFSCVFHRELYRPEYWCEITPLAASKAAAVQKLKQLYGFERVVCFGDSFNDIPMFEIADRCYAVENAVQKLKQLATGIIDGNNYDGVAKWLSANALAE